MTILHFFLLGALKRVSFHVFSWTVCVVHMAVYKLFAALFHQGARVYQICGVRSPQLAKSGSNWKDTESRSCVCACDIVRMRSAGLVTYTHLSLETIEQGKFYTGSVYI